MNSYTFVGGGSSNWASGFAAVIGGGASHEATGNSSTISGGWDHTAAGEYSMVPGGLANAANGRYALAAGQRAHADHEGSFVWADSTSQNFASTGPDQFAIRASGGLKLASADPGNPPHVEAWASDRLELRVGGKRAAQLAAFRYRESFGSIDIDDLANRAAGDFATISSGLGNEADDEGILGTIGGGSARGIHPALTPDCLFQPDQSGHRPPARQHEILPPVQILTTNC